MDIMSLFRSNPAVQKQQEQAAPVTPTTPGNLPTTPPTPTANTANTAANGTTPTQPADADKSADTPLANYKDMWEPITNTGEQQEAKPLDTTKLQEIIKQANFASVLTPDNLKAISEGGEGAITAFQESLNSVAQQVLLQSTIASDKMMETKIAEAMAAQQSNLPNLIRKHTTSNELNLKNPIFKDPAVKPVIEAVSHQLAAKNPDATPFEIVEMTNNFVAAMSEAFAPKTSQSNPNSKNDVDWEAFLNS